MRRDVLICWNFTSYNVNNLVSKLWVLQFTASQTSPQGSLHINLNLLLKQQITLLLFYYYVEEMLLIVLKIF